MIWQSNKKIASKTISQLPSQQNAQQFAPFLLSTYLHARLRVSFYICPSGPPAWFTRISVLKKKLRNVKPARPAEQECSTESSKCIVKKIRKRWEMGCRGLVVSVTERIWWSILPRGFSVAGFDLGNGYLSSLKKCNPKKVRGVLAYCFFRKVFSTLVFYPPLQPDEILFAQKNA